MAFNRVIAHDLRVDIDTCLAESPHDGSPNIQTMHALCLQVIGVPLRLLLPHEREAMLYDVLELFPPIRQEFPSHGAADQALRDHEAGLQDHGALWQAVDRWLRRHKAHLISDLPKLLLEKIRSGDHQEPRYAHVIVDEFQDLTAAEQLLFMRLRKDGGSVVVLGDSRQSIYRFRGNDREGLAKLHELDPKAVITDIPMQECQRCPPLMVDAANRLMTLYPPPMKPSSPTLANVHVVHWKTPQAEAKGMARHIVDNIVAHRDDRHLLMVTRRRFGYWLRDGIQAIDKDISVNLSFSESLLETWPVREAFLFFCLLADPDAPTWRAWLGYQAPDARDNVKAPSRNAGAYLRFLDAMGDKITAEGVAQLATEGRTAKRGAGGSNLSDRAKRFVKLTDALAVGGAEPEELAARVFDVGEWPDGATEESAIDMELVRTKCVAMIAESTEADAARRLRAVARQLRYMIATREPFEVSEDCDLQVTTLWGAKGVTAEHVYLHGLSAEAIPGERRAEYPGTDDEFFEEQRRLFYVSITRSKSTLVLSRAQKVLRGTAHALGFQVPAGDDLWVTLNMCPFLRDISPVLPDATRGDKWAGCT